MMRLSNLKIFSKEGRPLVRSKGWKESEGLILSTPSCDRTGGCSGGGDNDCGRAWWDF